MLELLGARHPSRAKVRALACPLLDEGADLATVPAELGPRLTLPSARWLDAQLRAVATLELGICVRGAPDFPVALANIPDPPMALFVAGQLPDPGAMAVAVIGSRRGSPGGCELARHFGGALGAAGIVVVSGLALGIDGAAHAGCLAADGVTLAVLGAGHAQLYPRRHRSLAAEIACRGAVLSEHPPQTAPLRHHFPERNRIISGLCRAVVVIEAGARSGSLITARCALEQGRDVLAVPGLPGGRARGCHRLIQAGAALVEDADDVLAALGLPARRGSASAAGPLDTWLARVLGQIDIEPTAIDDLAAALALAPEQVRAALVHLELLGFVASVDGGYIRRPQQ